MNTKRERSKSRTASLAVMLVLLFSAILVIPFIVPITMASRDVYNFVGIDTSSTTHLAYYISVGDLCWSKPPASLDMGTVFHILYSNEWYEQIASNDGNLASFGVDDGYYYMRFRFKIDEDITTIAKLDILWDGVGIAPSANGYTLYIWNGCSWEELNSR